MEHHVRLWQLTGKTIVLALFGLAAAALLLAASPAHALPVIPGATGYGMDTPAGRGGTVYKVTSLADTNTPGTLRYAINQSGPRVVVFEVSGTIQVDAYLTINNPYITIAGQTAPSPGIFLRGAVLRVMTHDVLLQHLRVAPGDDPAGVTPHNRDAFVIDGYYEDTYNIVVDHMTFTWSVDETINLWYPHSDVTFRHVIAAEPLHDSIHVDEGATEPAPHGFGPLFDNTADSRVALIGSLLSHAESRLPMVMSTDYVQINNVLYDRGHQFNYFVAQRGNHTNNTLIGNLYKNGPSLYNWAGNRKPIEIDNPFAGGGQFYLEDNQLLNHSISAPTQWDLINNRTSFTQGQLEASTPPASYPGMTAKPSGEVMDWVLDNAGARPADRPPYEERILDNARNGTGGMVDSVAEVGGWPVVASNYRALTIPANPHDDDDNDGYTNLEEWLHAFAAEVEGTDVGGEPSSGNISGLTVDSGATGADLWSVQTDLQSGDLTYADRTYTFTTVPSIVQGADWIRPAADSKSFTGSTLAEFEVVYDSDVYVALDERTDPAPAWLSGWTAVGQTIEVDHPTNLIPTIVYDLYRKSFAAGAAVTLGNNGDTVNPTYIPIVKALPAITGLAVDSGATGADLWVVKTDLQNGDLTYADRTYTFTTVPSIVQGADWIRPAADSKSFTGSTLAEFEVVYDSDVYVALDERTDPAPAWLSGWTAVGETIEVDHPTQAIPTIVYDLYRKSFAAGATVTLGNNGDTVNPTYIPIVKALPISGLTVDSGADGASLWSVEANLQNSDLAYVDRTYPLSAVPVIVQGADWISPAADSKTFTGAVLAEFVVPYASDVYVAFDDRTDPAPGWLSGWADTNEDVTVTDPIAARTFSLYKKSFPAGATVTLGNSGHPTNLIYIPIVKLAP